MQKQPSVVRIRVGLLVWLFSWLPFPVILLAILHNNGQATDPQASSRFLAICYGIQFLIGFIGLFVAGKEAAMVMKATGRRALPRTLWRVIRYGELPS